MTFQWEMNVGHIVNLIVLVISIWTVVRKIHGKGLEELRTLFDKATVRLEKIEGHLAKQNGTLVHLTTWQNEHEKTDQHWHESFRDSLDHLGKKLDQKKDRTEK